MFAVYLRLACIPVLRACWMVWRTRMHASGLGVLLCFVLVVPVGPSGPPWVVLLALSLFLFFFSLSLCLS